MNKKLQGKIAALALSQVDKAGYIWGADGEYYSKSWIRTLIARYGSKHYIINGVSAEKWGDDGERDFDCSGFWVWILRLLGIVSKTFDDTAEGLKRGRFVEIEKQDLRDGDAVFRGKPAVHVGIYHQGKVIHAKGTAYGVVKTDELDTFDSYGRLKELYDAEDIRIFRAITTLHTSDPKVINTVEYWENLVYTGEIKYVSQLILNMAKYIGGKQDG